MNNPVYMVYCTVVVVGSVSESGKVALRVRYKGSCLTASSWFFYITLPILNLCSLTLTLPKCTLRILLRRML